MLGISRYALTDLAKRGIVERGKKRGAYKLQATVNLLPAPALWQG
jgi:hypothetical protein